MKHNIKELDAQKCIGCFACKNVCPVDCIIKEKDGYGFEYPVLDESKCIKCGRCSEICPVLNKVFPKNDNDVFAAQSTDVGKRLKSSSGGIFGLIAEKAQADGYAIYGAVIDEKQYVRHIRVQNGDFTAMRGSKYVQSDVSDIYEEIKSDVENGVKVLFSGTPCQVAAVKKFAENKAGYKEENFIFVDLICHGVGAPKLWEDYIALLGKPESIKDISFRDKSTGWRNSSFSFILGDGKQSLSHEQCHFMKAYGSNLCIRRSCFNCEFKGFDRVADITLGDFWDKDISEYKNFKNDDTGISTVIVHSDKMRKILEELKSEEKIVLQKYSGEKLAQHNKCVITSIKPSKKQQKFDRLLLKGYPLDKAIQKALKRSFFEKCINKVIFEIKKILKIKN